MFRIACLLIGYAFGLLQTSFIIGKMSGIDIREHGSKSAGFTNTNRVLGIKKGAIVFFIDILKCVAAIVIARAIFGEWHVLSGLYAGIGAMLGHVFPFYMKFKGGKGVACLLGLIIMLDWRVMAVSFLIGLVAVCITRFISVASMLIATSMPLAMFAFGHGREAVALGAAICVFTCFLHHANIVRLVNGVENKFSFKKKLN